ncbi:hypothetical protein PTSG_08415 [Salpingoeca rosetta]|uniref:Carbohydrate-binding domain-containing protein n=1 Tax=Salpingoeca rosetta (strain ATCC 50818 / BSB-021) TaxID=946362 RepID=F2UJM2_SALR5|nr:uncharacterized protein PTSG_08415 [Salpingoeca rosetta]EGD77321.1 hypothetical protein PTSG_08415 [Salpingoeca rosetta]|eukprot:XP_004990665.1 hypothetical protein PTSG_08415 [Salpingoeca rosetta]
MPYGKYDRFTTPDSASETYFYSAQPMYYSGYPDHSVEVRFAWSDTHVFLLAIVNDDFHRHPVGAGAFAGDALRVAFHDNPNGPAQAAQAIFDVGLTSGGAVQGDYGLCDAVRDATLATTTYECRFSLARMFGPGADVTTIGASITVSDADADDYLTSSSDPPFVIAWSGWAPDAIMNGAEDSSKMGLVNFKSGACTSTPARVWFREPRLKNLKCTDSKCAAECSDSNYVPSSTFECVSGIWVGDVTCWRNFNGYHSQFHFLRTYAPYDVNAINVLLKENEQNVPSGAVHRRVFS